MLQGMRKAAGDRQQGDLINRDDFNAVIKQIDKFQPPDMELFTQLFVLFDEAGHDEVDYRTFVAGAAVCLMSCPLIEKLKFALSIYGAEGKQHCQRGDLRRMMLAVNTTTAYFGDPVLQPAEIDSLSLEAFKMVPGGTAGLGLSHEDAIAFLLKEPAVRRFMQGEGTVRFGSPELTA